MSKQDRNELVEVDCVVLHETAKAVLIEKADEVEIWIPKSLCEVEGTQLKVQHWKAKMEGLI